RPGPVAHSTLNTHPPRGISSRWPGWIGRPPRLLACSIAATEESYLRARPQRVSPLTTTCSTRSTAATEMLVGIVSLCPGWMVEPERLLRLCNPFTSTPYLWAIAQSDSPACTV